MHFIRPDMHTRRAFLRRTGQLALTGAALPTAINLAAMGEAAAFNATDYKALVCIFLNGGNDYANTVVNYDPTTHGLYSGIRTNIALSRESLVNTVLNPTTLLPGGVQYALHPAMTGLAGLFNAGQAAVQLNVGPLVMPITRQQYNARSVPTPPKLFSHNDQQSVWQSSAPEGSPSGWGGRIGDLALSNGANNPSLFTCISVTGNAVFLAGNSALSYQVGTGGPVRVKALDNLGGPVYGSELVKSTITALALQERTHRLEKEYNLVTGRAHGAFTQISEALAEVPANDARLSALPANNNLADQLKMVARLIAARGDLGTRRQVFFVSIGGFDLHDNLITGQNTLMGRLSAAMTGFYQATAALGVADKVTAFTASDFGRTLTSNGDGSDHGWGSHHLIVGGAVRGRAFYGKAPPVSVTNSTTDAFDQWHVGQGRLLPSTSVDQYAGTLATWFGVQGTEMNGILPNLGNFNSGDSPRDMGFMVNPQA
ncbi:DUF1501 domain-containing protein [Hydrogenophaga sp.]|uniref:DUF1501 domain-containing protein n=1 Tax=Hydrogenophaga sp. TaxID=1904254 RepID=UPI00273459BF|nr:DUF1501 domain-containing protein [Hydrogenophaga sp.]MDP3110382.1 DUF1501 domain-containing protein [Hydrogenophaga sp.]